MIPNEFGYIELVSCFKKLHVSSDVLLLVLKSTNFNPYVLSAMINQLFFPIVFDSFVFLILDGSIKKHSLSLLDGS